jgi:hypothetical protein
MSRKEQPAIAATSPNEETMTADPGAPAASAPPGRGALRRWAQATLFVAIWMGLGWTLRLDGNSYLLVGIPLSLFFQLVVRRASLRSLWVRAAPPFPSRAIGFAVPLAILPVAFLIGALMERQWVVALWMASAAVGAVAAGYALVQLRKPDFRPFVSCQLTAGTIGIAVMVAGRLARGGLSVRPLTGLQDFLLYFPVCFVLEEVSFRGALDSHLHQPGDRFYLGSAVWGAALWGLWHLPVLPAADQRVVTALVLACIHCLIGVPLAVFWRRTGNLAVTAFAHALVDGVRNALG